MALLVHPLRMNRKHIFKALGIMNGTSIDGVDYVQIAYDLNNKTIKLKQEKSFSFPATLQRRLRQATQHLLNVAELAELHYDLGRFYSQCFKKLPPQMKKNHVIGLHGQTVYHRGGAATLQIGEGSFLAFDAKTPVVQDFRAADIAAHGQGAPLATYFHHFVFAQKNKNICVHNLGGISNVTVLKGSKVLQSFDTGPANMLLDLHMQKSGKKQFDDQGRLARNGRANLELINEMLEHNYFKLTPPKSCGREEFGEIFLAQFMKKSKSMTLRDRQASLTVFTALSIVESYSNFVKIDPDEIIFCGGGAKNKFLIECIKNFMPETKISTSVDHGWTLSSIEGAAFALMALQNLLGEKTNLPQTTGAKQSVHLGKLIVC